ncbi:MAG: response regulator transcription factor [Erysipelotrichales bacterium]
MKVILIDDDKLVTLSLKTILEVEGLDVVACGEDGNEALGLYKEYQPDIVLMDVRMKEKKGIDAAKDILNYDKDAKIILLTTFVDDDYILEAISCGVKGYLLKQDYEKLVDAIEKVTNSQIVYSNEILSRIPNAMNPNNDNVLSYKELKVVKLIAQGLNNKEISQEIYLSEGTVRNYISNILTKLDLRDRTQIAIYYYTKISK